MKNYLFRCMWEDSAEIFHIAVDADNIRDARNIFARRMDNRKSKREFCLLRVYREV